MSRRISAFLQTPDQWLLFLRFILLGGAFLSGIVSTLQWLFLLLGYSIFCAVVYFLLYRHYPKTRSIYYASIYGDLLFIAFGVIASGGWKSEGYLGFFLVTSTAAAYFGYRIFPAVPFTASILYLTAIWIVGGREFPLVVVLVRCFAFWILPFSVALFHEWRQLELLNLRLKRKEEADKGGILLNRVFTVKEEMCMQINRSSVDAMRLMAGELGKAINNSDTKTTFSAEQLLGIGINKGDKKERIDFTSLLKEVLLKHEGELLKCGIRVKKLFADKPIWILGNQNILKQGLKLLLELGQKELKYGGKLILEEHIENSESTFNTFSFTVIIAGQISNMLTGEDQYYDNNSWLYFVPFKGDLRPLELYSIVLDHGGTIIVEVVEDGIAINIRFPLALVSMDGQLEDSSRNNKKECVLSSDKAGVSNV